MIKFYLLAVAMFAIVAGGAYYAGYSNGRTKFANECITIGNFVVWDYGQDKQRRFKCIEAEMETKPPAEDKIRT